MGLGLELIITNEAMCRDCYRCVRACPVKAIKIKTEKKKKIHAQIIDSYCILDGSCVLVCPQKAKIIKSDLGAVQKLIDKGVPLAVSLAPSFVTALPLERPEKLPAILKGLGFSVVQEAAVGAELIAAEYRQGKYKKPLIDSSCPVIVNLVEKHFPNLIPWLSTVVSPMIAHGRYLKQQHKNITTVFIGTCIAKKGESADPQLSDAIDYVIGFDELWNWIQEKQLDLKSMNLVPFDQPFPDLARLFPVEGGFLKSIALSTDKLEIEAGSITGLKNCNQYLKQLSTGKIEHPPMMMEMSACRGGCIGGPRSATRDGVFIKRQKIIEYYKSYSGVNSNPNPGDKIYLESHLLRRKFNNKKQLLVTPNEKTIKSILAQTGKYRPEDELNCKACGYNSCRDKAIAVYQGMAEVQMCIPYMRQRAEYLSNIVLNSMPNGAIIVNNKFEIIEINSKAQELFRCRAENIIGEDLDKLIDASNFRLAAQKGQLVNVLANHPDYGIVTRQIVFSLEQEKIIVGIFVDITEEQRNKEQLNKMKNQTIERAQEVIVKQMKVAQEIAGLLGETTAETKVLLTKLIKLTQDSPAFGERGSYDQ